MRLHAIVVSFLVTAVWHVEQHSVAAQQDIFEQEMDMDVDQVNKNIQYDVSKAGFGNSIEEAYEQFGVVLNSFDTYGQIIQDSNKLIFFYILNSAKVDEGKEANNLHYGIIGPVIRDMQGIIDVVVFDCMHPQVTIRKMHFASLCDTETNPLGFPNLQKVVPPRLKKNPYTGEPMQKNIVQFTAGAQISQQILKDFLVKEIPDYTIKIKSKKQFQDMVKNENEQDINKVLLFTKKEKVTLPFKAVSAQLRDKIRFYIIYVSEKNAPADLVELAGEYKVTEFPKLIIEQTHDTEFDKMLDMKQVVYEGKSYKYKDLHQFMSKFARQVLKEENEKMEQQKEAQQSEEETKKADIVELNAENFDEQIAQSEEGCAVYFTTLGKDQVIAKEFRYYNQLIRLLQGPIKLAVFRMDPNDPNFKELKKSFKVMKLDAGKPDIRYYPNQQQGQAKLDRAYSLPLDLESKDFSRIQEEIETTFDSSILDIDGHMFNQYIIQYAKQEQKHVVYFMYRDDQTISLTFQHLSNHYLFKEECVFLAMKNPPLEQFQGLKREMMPSIGFIPRLDEKFEEGHIQQANMEASQPYHTILKWVASQAGKIEELMDSSKAQEKKVRLDRNFGEITSGKDFDDRCVSYKKGCAIAILPAMGIQDYEKENFENHIKVMQDIDKDAGQLPIFYSWINSTCHPEWLKYFDVDPFQIPTVVFYYPEKERQANLIGQFNPSTIEDHQERFMKGKLASWSPKTKHHAMKFEWKDCSLGLGGDDSESSDLDDEILKEILAEEEERRKKAEEEQDGEDSKKKKGKKKGKKGKKGKKSSKSEEKDDL